MNPFESAFTRATADPRYLNNLDWGRPRRGHPEGTVRAHITELEQNLKSLRSRLSVDRFWKLKLLIHTHDAFKPDATEGAPITDPRSHASLARAFLAEFSDDADLLAMVQFHDEPYALWKQTQSRGACNPDRFAALLGAIKDWSLFLAFLIIDGCTEGKSREPLQWIFAQLEDKVESEFTANDIIEQRLR